MITSIQGTLTSATPLHAIIELNGFGYEVNIPVTTAERLPANGTVVKLHTHVIYREDAQTLYGFATTTDRDFFRLMIEHVTGIGPKSALTIMSRLSVELLESAIRSGDLGMLSKCPGIGKKTAERLLLELKGKLGGDVGGLFAVNTSDAQSDIQQALLALGYSDKEAAAALKSLPADVAVSEGIKLALKALNK